MTFVLAIVAKNESERAFGAGYGAIKFRDCLTRQLESGDAVQVDFTGAFVTQAFDDQRLNA